MNLTKKVFLLKVRNIKNMGRTPELTTEEKRIVLSFVDMIGGVSWETVCKASTYDVLNNQYKKYLAWMAEA